MRQKKPSQRVHSKETRQDKTSAPPAAGPQKGHSYASARLRQISYLHTHTDTQTGNKGKGKKGEWTGTNPRFFIRVQGKTSSSCKRKRSQCIHAHDERASKKHSPGRSQIVPPHRFWVHSLLFLPQTPLDTGTFTSNRAFWSSSFYWHFHSLHLHQPSCSPRS